jgi:transposase
MLGVDVGKAELQIRWHGAVPNSAAGIAQLLRRAPAGPVVVEPTGRYGEPLVRAVQAAGRVALLAPPRKARAFLQSEQSRAKTDRLDSAGLALYGLSGRLRPYPLPSDAVDQVRQLLAARRGLTRSLATLKQQQAALPRAAEALAPAVAALAQQVGTLDRQLAALLAEDAAPPAPAPAAPAGSARGAAARPARPAPTLASARALQAVPGIGPVTAAALAACLVDKQFTSADQFVAYIGLDIRVRQSGRRHSQFGLSKHGDAELRRLLYLAAQAGARCRADRTLADRYAREKAKGLAPTAALNAVARKLAKLAWSMVTHGSTYDPTRVDAQPRLDTQT